MRLHVRRPDFIKEILGRPENERPFFVMVVGYPAEGTLVSDIQRKTFE